MRTSLRDEQGAQFGEHRGGRFEHVAVRVAAELVAARVCLPLPPAVLLPRAAGVVEAVAVELDGQAVLGPSAVDAPTARNAIHDRQGQPVSAQQLEEAALQLAERDARLAAHDRAELPGARGVRPQHGVDLPRRGAVADPGLVAGAGEVVEVERGGEVDERLRDGGDRDAAELGAGRPAAVGGDAPHPPLAGAVTSGFGTAPFTSPHMYAAARPLSSASFPCPRTDLVAADLRRAHLAPGNDTVRTRGNPLDP